MTTTAILPTPHSKKFFHEVSKRDVEDIIFFNLERYDLKKKGLDNLKGILKPIFDLAFQEYWIDDNPYMRVDFKKFSNMLVEDTPIDRRFHSKEEIEKMLSYIHREMILLETPNPETDSRNAIVEHTKTNKKRKFPVTKEIRELLNRLSKAHKENP